MRRHIWLLVGLLGAVSCGPLPTPPAPPQTPPAAIRAVGTAIHNPAGQGLAGAVCRLQVAADVWVASTPAADTGYVLFTPVPASLTDTQVECTADGFAPLSLHKNLARDLDAAGNLAPLVMHLLVDMRRGVVRLDGHAFVDDDGIFLGRGASLMWGGWGCLHDRDRLEARNLAIARGAVDYVRALAVVGPRGWIDRTVAAADMADAVACFTDLAYDRFGLRVDWTIFGGTDTTPTPADREALVRRFVAVVAPRAAKVSRVQLGNESWTVGFEDDAGRAELRRLAAIVLDGLPNLASTTSPQYTDGRDVAAWYDGLGASNRLIVAVHPDRSTNGTGGIWRPVRQAWDPQFWTRLAWDADEPIGPQSSVAEDDDPLRLTMAAALTWLCGGAGYTLHTGAGVRGGGAEDLARGRVTNLDQVAHVAETLAGIAAVRALLPVDLPNWQRHNTNRNFPDYPFNTDRLAPLVERGDLLRAFAATAPDGRLVAMPIVARVPVPFEARRAMHLEIYDPLTGARLDAVDLAAGETYTLAPRDAAILIGR